MPSIPGLHEPPGILTSAELQSKLDEKWAEELRTHMTVAKNAAEQYARIVKESNGRVIGSVAEVYELQTALLKTNWVPEPDIPDPREEWMRSASMDGDW